MPQVVNLYRKDTGECATKDKAGWIALDEELCNHVGLAVDPDQWVCGWYDSFGFRLAVGMALDDPRMIEDLKDYKGLEAIRAYLAENYTTSTHKEWN